MQGPGFISFPHRFTTFTMARTHIPGLNLLTSDRPQPTKDMVLLQPNQATAPRKGAVLGFDEWLKANPEPLKSQAADTHSPAIAPIPFVPDGKNWIGLLLGILDMISTLVRS